MSQIGALWSIYIAVGHLCLLFLIEAIQLLAENILTERVCMIFLEVLDAIGGCVY